MFCSKIKIKAGLSVLKNSKYFIFAKKINKNEAR